MRLKLAVLGLAALGSVALAGPATAAMPNGISQANQITGPSSNVQEARWVCNGWGRCWWRPNFYGAYGFYRGPGPGPFWWHRHHRWHRWGYWHRW